MAKRRALIVDDSKTAQMRLRKMLERFELDVDTVMSAEEALGYLTYRQPAVIFLDHHMEGMDGLEALKIIKSNPATALIPVIMYTSEQGDVYVGQARALGAIDIIGKEVIKQADLKKVLGSLGVGPKGQAEEPQASATATHVAARALPPATDGGSDESVRRRSESYSANPPPTDANNLDQVQRQISRLFEIHITKVRQEIEDNTKFLFRRLTKEIQEKNKHNARAATAAPAERAEASPASEPVPQPTRRFGGGALFTGALLLLLLFMGVHLLRSDRHQAHQNEQLAALVEEVRAQETRTEALLQRMNGPDDAAGRNYANRQVLLDALSWAVNVDTQFGFGEAALNDQRIYMLGELLGLVRAADFTGTVYLDVHMGNFCVIEDMAGRLMLPEPESNLEDCMFLAEQRPETPLGDQVSVGFMNYLQSAPILAEGDIDVEMSSQGYASPRFSYPAATSAVSAGEWNSVAQKNNRIAVSFTSN